MATGVAVPTRDVRSSRSEQCSHANTENTSTRYGCDDTYSSRFGTHRIDAASPSGTCPDYAGSRAGTGATPELPPRLFGRFCHEP